jgi:hypothetical protein
MCEDQPRFYLTQTDELMLNSIKIIFNLKIM